MANQPDPRHVVTQEPSLSIQHEMELGGLHIYVLYTWDRSPSGLPSWRVTIANAENAEQVDASPYLWTEQAGIDLMNKAYIDLSGLMIAGPEALKQVSTIDYLKNLLERDDDGRMERTEPTHPGAYDRGT